MWKKVLFMVLATLPVFASEISPIQITLNKDPLENTMSSHLVRRVVYDINGSAVRVLVADVNPVTNRIENKLFNAQITVPFRQNLNMTTKCFNPEVVAIATKSFQQLSEAIAKYQPMQQTAIAVDTFLMAKNGQELLDTLSRNTTLPFHVVDQRTKGELEFYSGVANNDTIAKKTVVIDMCTMNAHITGLSDDGAIVTFGEKLGHGIISDYIAKNIRKLATTPADINPVTEAEALETIRYISSYLSGMPLELKEKLHSKDVRIIATFTPVIGEKSWKNEHSWKFLQENILNRVSDPTKAPILASKALFIHTLINQMGIEECTLTGMDVLEGSTAGVMISKRFWE